MMNDTTAFEQVIQNEIGFWEISPKPSKKDLKEYYSNTYYQDARGSYQTEYTKDELKYIQNGIKRRWEAVRDRFRKPGRLIDVGCGEGFTLAQFRDLGWEVKGIDFSSAGVEAQNPDCLHALTVGDVFDLLHHEIKMGNKYELVWLQNVLEHVLDPIELMLYLLDITAPDGVLVVTVPNDFSALQLKALENGQIDRPFWVVPPDHVNYFSHESLRAIGASTGWACFEVLGEFPVDWYLFHPASNYFREKAAGKLAHQARISIDNLISERDPADVVRFYSALAAIGMGRDLSAFFTPSR